MLILSNRISEILSDTWLSGLLGATVAQSPRKIWLVEPGDVVVTPLPVPPAFKAYACELIEVDPDAVTVLTVPSGTKVPLAEAVRRDGVMGRLREIAEGRPEMRILPYQLDRSIAELAATLGLPLHHYGSAGVGNEALDAVYRLNAKSGFREAAERLAFPVPDGRVCRDAAELRAAVSEMSAYPQLIVKPARSSNGYGITRLPQASPAEIEERISAYLRTAGDLPGGWVVEEYIDAALDVSVQVLAEPGGARVLYHGMMRNTEDAYRGYCSPLPETPETAGEGTDRLLWMGERFGHYLAEHGYYGHCSVDARLTGDGRVYAIESNVRRTGTTTFDVLVHRLVPDARVGGGAGAPGPVWVADCRPGGMPRDFGQAVARLRTGGLAFDRKHAEGAVLLNSALVPEGRWSYLVIGDSHERVLELERAVHAELGLR
ncbi:peptide ligase PGM1-related protein [Streptomyces gobiensis]|uniref:preATP grasp domain-containing protein n=1 Tax=Streptomyces gobiensis TaxID=2875706 RepID=UPI001E4E8CD1|nr:peptide ligase PGM1-related protein [Streptomyces gobiensis]UGY92779.1 peptide ligase PGM1-related protein [Streptomyces gobiensis]